jgi:hypothetical protein
LLIAADMMHLRWRTLAPVVVLSALWSSGCDSGPAMPGAPFSLEPFKAMARRASCADATNRLFLIDAQLVFWSHTGSCADAGYGMSLYGGSPDELFCSFRDSIAGPRRQCRDDRYRVIFDVVVAHLGEADLGLGTGHSVQPIPF